MAFVPSVLQTLLLTDTSSLNMATNGDSLPLEVLELIALESPLSWKAMLSIPLFARNSFSGYLKSLVRKRWGTVFKIVTPCGDPERREERSFERHFLCGKLDRIDGLPAIRESFYNITEKKETLIVLRWYEAGRRHREGLPAVVVVSGTRLTKEWWEHGVFIRSSSMDLGEWRAF